VKQGKHGRWIYKESAGEIVYAACGDTQGRGQSDQSEGGCQRLQRNWIVQMTSSPEVCRTDGRSHWHNGNQTGMLFYLEWTGHSWKAHYGNDPVHRGLSWMVVTLDHWCDRIT